MPGLGRAANAIDDDRGLWRAFLPLLVEALCAEGRIIEAPEDANDTALRHLAVAYVVGSTDRHAIRTARRRGVAIPEVLAETAQ